MSWLDELEAKARAATPGPWQHELLNHEVWSPSELYVVIKQFARVEPRESAGISKVEDAEFIAAANPATVLRLCELLRAWRTGLLDMEEHCYNNRADISAKCRALLDKLERGEP